MDKIDELLTRGVAKIYPSREELERVLRSGKKLKLYQGFDPSGIQLHIGHMVGLKKLKQWQELGHEVIFLIGDGTGQAGDPSGKTRGREQYLSNKELRDNARDYVLQAGKIVDFRGINPAKILYNGDWLNRLSLIDVLNIASNFTLQQLEERDMFVERKKRKEPINLREFLYPLLQGYDSVAMDVDLEVGGDDQTFNMLCGRTLVKHYLKKEKFVMTTPLLADTSGKKIGKTEGNVIALTAPPKEFLAMIMTLPDEVICDCLEYLTDLSLEEINTIRKRISRGENPMIFKKKLAYLLCEMLNGKDAAGKALHEFENVVQKKELPKDIPALKITQSITLVDFFNQYNLSESKSFAKRLIEQGGVEIQGEKITDPKYILEPNTSVVIKIGRKKFVRINSD